MALFKLSSQFQYVSQTALSPQLGEKENQKSSGEGNKMEEGKNKLISKLS